jgi:hypothetical protein
MKYAEALDGIRHRTFFWIVACLLLLQVDALAYAVAAPVELEKLTEEADIIFKAKAVSSAAVKDAWFKPVSSFEARETEFKIVSIIKGAHAGDTLRFRHYDVSEGPQMRVYQPQYYHFEAGGTYIVFAKQTEAAGVFRQLWANHKSRDDQGVLRCGDDKPVPAGKVKEIVWAELQALLQSPLAKDVTYAMRQLDMMSSDGGHFDGTKDFERSDVLKAIGPLMTNDQAEIARAAIGVAGSRNPYMSDDRAEFWLATVGTAEIPGIGKMDPKMKNFGGEFFWKELIGIADGKADAGTRALAIRALGLVRKPTVREALARWVKDSEASMRAAAALLAADSPQAESLEYLSALSKDPAPEVRRCAAYAIGYTQQVKLAGKLGGLLKDQDGEVRRAASQSLLSFSPKDAAMAKVFQENISNEEFSPLFLNALAREKPEDHLDALAKVVVEKTQPKNWRGGQIPSFTAWNILFKYLQSRPGSELHAGKFDRYLDAMEKGYVTGSSEPRDIYAFYLQRGMSERAKRYRAEVKKTATYNLDYFFDQVDENPGRFTR